MNKRKEFSKLNLLDRFLFDEAMEDISPIAIISL